jgi:hypothetical protein
LREVERRRHALERTDTSNTLTHDRSLQLEDEMKYWEERAESHKNEFMSISCTLREELGRFDRSKVEDLKRAVQSYFKAMLESQREVTSDLRHLTILN